LVDHAIARAIHKGAIGTIIAEGENNPEIYESFATEEWVDGHTHNGEEPMHEPEMIEEEPEEEESLEAAENEVIVEIMKGSMKKDDDPTNDYSPNILTVPVGTTVTWINKDVSVHTVTDRGRLFNSGNMRKGKKWSYTFTKAGEFDYYCIPHPWMVGKVIVK
jgi:plastocyanin